MIYPEFYPRHESREVDACIIVEAVRAVEREVARVAVRVQYMVCRSAARSNTLSLEGISNEAIFKLTLGPEGRTALTAPGQSVKLWKPPAIEADAHLRLRTPHGAGHRVQSGRSDACDVP